MILTSSSLSSNIISSSSAPSRIANSSRRGYVGRPVVTATSRPPILIEFTDTTLHWGLVGDAKPKHVLPFSNMNSSNNNMMILFGAASTNQGDKNTNVVYMRQINVSIGTWYRTLSPLLQQVYHSLGPDGKERRVIVLLPPHFAIPSNNNSDLIILPNNFKVALLQCLLQNNSNNDTAVGTTAGTNTNTTTNISVSIQSSISFVPYALPMISTAMMLVHVGSNDSINSSNLIGDISCMIHATGHSLPFTFQTIPISSNTSSNGSGSTDSIKMDDIVLAILKCLQACPRAARKEVIQNIIFCGSGVMHRPDLPLQVAKHVQQVLQQPQQKTDDTAAPAKPKQEEEEEPQDDDNNDEEEPKTTNRTIHHYGFGIVPINLKELQPLAEFVGLVDYVVFEQNSNNREIRRRPRPDLLAWTGASLWAWHWHNHTQNDAQFHWISK